MKPKLSAVFAIALAAPVLAGDTVFATSFEPEADPPGVIIVDTPVHSNSFTGCRIDATWFARHGTVSTIIADCAGHASPAQEPGWQPSEHPDLAPLYWEGRLRVDGSARVFMQCVVLDYKQSYGQTLVIAECLDDPF